MLEADIAASEDETRKVLAAALDSNIGIKSEVECLTREPDGLQRVAENLSKNLNVWRLLIRHHDRLSWLSGHPYVVWLATWLDWNAELF